MQIAPHSELDFTRSQVYAYLSCAFLYPQENWTEDLPLLRKSAQALGLDGPEIEPLELAQLQRAYRGAFGMAGPQCYETEYGLPHEYRQSQELADISGFYRAFGFELGGMVRERPDHLAVELEFMHVLALKAWRATKAEHAEICLEGQRKFLGDHLARWLEAFAQKFSSGGPYRELAEFTAQYVAWDAQRLGADTTSPVLPYATPFDADSNCAGCSADLK